MKWLASENRMIVSESDSRKGVASLSGGGPVSVFAAYQAKHERWRKV